MSTTHSSNFLVFGHDTVECSYYLSPYAVCGLDFASLIATRDELRLAKRREEREVSIGDVPFLLSPNGSKSGYPLILSNPDMTICCGPYNSPSFHVTYSSFALWREGIQSLHDRFIAWVKALGFHAFREETLGRVDFTFDYQLPTADFTEDDVVSLSVKDVQYRANRQIQTMQFGRDAVVLRIYDKIAEINESSRKTWFYPIWGCSDGVWRIEWQARKDMLRRFDIRTVEDLLSQQGDLLHHLSSEHDTLRRPNEDSNRSRWPLHPLWVDLQSRISALPSTGVYRSMDERKLLDERMMRLAVSVYGYLKQVAALIDVRQQLPDIKPAEALRHLSTLMQDIHDPLTWREDVAKRVAKIRLGSR